MAAPHWKLLASVISLFVVAPALLAPGAAASPEDGGYPRKQGQEHIGQRCTPDDPMVAGGTIVGIGGQVVAGGGGSGVGCDTFYAYEVRTSEPTIAVPWAEPGVYLNPGAAAPTY